MWKVGRSIAVEKGWGGWGNVGDMRVKRHYSLSSGSTAIEAPVGGPSTSSHRLVVLRTAAFPEPVVVVALSARVGRFLRYIIADTTLGDIVFAPVGRLKLRGESTLGVESVRFRCKWGCG